MTKIMSLLTQTRGAATIELALAAPLLAALVIGMVDLSHAYSTKVQLEQIAQRIVEKAQQNGFETSDESTLETEATAAATAAGIASSSANVTYWLECTNGTTTTTTSYSNQCNTGELYARYMQIDIQKSYSPIILASFAGMTSSGQSSANWTLHGVAGVRVQ